MCALRESTKSCKNARIYERYENTVACGFIKALKTSIKGIYQLYSSMSGWSRIYQNLCSAFGNPSSFIKALVTDE